MQFLLGKFVGTLLPIFLFSLGILVLLSILLWWRSDTLVQDISVARVTLPQILAEAWTSGLFQVLKFCVLGAMVFAVASFSQSFTYTVSMGFALFIASHLVHLATDFYREGETVFSRTVAFVLAYVLPDFRIFNEPVADPDFLLTIGYAAIYVVVFLGVAIGFFQRREL